MTTRPVCALTIAGSDSGGGAGIQADLKTFAAHGVHGLSAVAALTAQHTRGVTAVHVPPAGFLRAQIDACFEDFQIGAVKLGMLANAEVIHAVATGSPRCLAASSCSRAAVAVSSPRTRKSPPNRRCRWVSMRESASGSASTASSSGRDIATPAGGRSTSG